MQSLKDLSSYTKRLFDAEDMRAAEMNAVDMGIDPEQLMEGAGAAVASFIEAKYGNAKSVLIVCGLGNNGGDGFVVARYLAKAHSVTVALAGEEELIKPGPALANFIALKRVKTVKLVEKAYDKITATFADKELIVDALFGTGFHGEPNVHATKLIKAMNNAGVPMVAVDLPSGLDATTGEFTLKVDADHTITFHKNKVGLERAKIKNVIVRDIGIPLEAELLSGSGDIYLATRARDAYASKKDNGSVLLIGGSGEYHGAPSLAANGAYNSLAALRVGAGYTVLFVPKSVEQACRKLSPNVIVHPLGESDISTGNLADAEKAMDKADSVVIGMGLSKSEKAAKAATRLIDTAMRKGKKLVVDADALYSLKDKKLNKNVVITPEDSQFKHLYKSVPEKRDIVGRANAAIALSKKVGAVVLLKGHDTIITDGELLKINAAKTSALATMGTGDVLSGMVGAYQATGASAFRSAVAAAQLHSRAGDALYAEKGAHIIAADVVDNIPRILKRFDKSVG